MNLIFFLLMFCGGIMVAIQPSVNARLAQRVGTIESAMISFAVGTLALLVVTLLVGKGSMRGVLGVPMWQLSGGLLGAFFVTAMIFVVPRIGTTAAMASVIAAQLCTGLVIDRLGFFGLQQIPLDGKRVAGAVLLLVGAALILRR